MIIPLQSDSMDAPSKVVVDFPGHTVHSVDPCKWA